MYQLRMKPEDGYLYVYIAGDGTLENYVACWHEVIEECSKHNIYKILAENYLTRRMSTTDIYSHAKSIAEIANIPQGTKVATVTSKENFQDREFASTVGTNRGRIKARAFTDIEEAKRWLLE